MELQKLFTRSVAWNTVEAVLYQGILLGHQLLLFRCMPHSAYGLVGALFSMTYLAVTAINFGFDVSLAPFFNKATQSKQDFKKILFVQLIPEYVVLAVLSIIILLVYHGIPTEIVDRYQLTLPLLALLMMLAFLESTKKTLRAILHLSFFNKQTMTAEIVTIVSYVTIVWSCYALGFALSLPVIFVPMLITSAYCCLHLGYHVAQVYAQLPAESNNSVTWTTQAQLLKNRFFNVLNQASHTIFSSNFLVPFFAVQFGLQQAGILKLASTIAYCITTIIYKVFGISSASLLARIKEESLQQKQTVFTIISNKLNQALVMIGIFFIFNFHAIMSWSTQINNAQTWHLLYLFFVITFSETLFIAYEKFYIIEEKANYLFIFNLMVMSCMAGIFYYTSAITPTLLLLAIIGVRIMAFACLSALSFYYWQLKPSYSVNPWLTAGSIAVSYLFFILT